MLDQLFDRVEQLEQRVSTLERQLRNSPRRA
jgi:chaperonin cofactor prefoldin